MLNYLYIYFRKILKYVSFTKLSGVSDFIYKRPMKSWIFLFRLSNHLLNFVKAYYMY